jgi:acyl-CoA thioesterase I
LKAARLPFKIEKSTRGRHARPTTMSNFAPLGVLRRRAAIWSALAAALIIGGCESRSAPTAPSAGSPEPAAVRRIVVLGDSLAVSPSADQSFPSELQARIARQGLRWTVTNAGITGDTTAGGLRRVESLLASDVGVLLVALGANDGLRGIDVSMVEKNLSMIIDLAQRRNVRVLLCGIETPPTHGWDYTVAFHYVFPRLAQQYAVPLVPFLLSGVVLTPGLNGPDGIHPNAAGARRIADTIWPYLEPLVQQ